MGKKVLMEGSQAICEAAVRAGCRFYAAYPIQPNTALLEQMSRRMPDVGGVCMNAESELEAINMVWGAASTGTRSLCSSTGTAVSLMQESMAEMANAGIPYVFIHMARGQSEYFQATRGGGHSDYRYIVLAPHTVQEAVDLIQEAFYLSDLFQHPVLVQADYILGHTVEPVEFKGEGEGELPPKTWAIRGAKGRPPRVMSFISGGIALGERTASYGRLLERSADTNAYIQEHLKPRVETGFLDDAELAVAAFGFAGRFTKYAVKLAREQGMKVGYIRPITLWPFPMAAVANAARKVKAIAVFETNAGQMIEDVRLAVEGSVPVHFIGRISTDDSGFGVGDAVYAENILAGIKRVYEGLKQPASRRRR